MLADTLGEERRERGQQRIIMAEGTHMITSTDRDERTNWKWRLRGHWIVPCSCIRCLNAAKMENHKVV